MPIQVLVTRDFEQMSEVAALRIRRRLQRLEREKREIVLGLATGNSPTGVYARLVEAANRKRLDSRRWRTFNLDEYVGLPNPPGGSAPHPSSFRHFMERHLFGLLERRPEATFVPEGERVDVARFVRELDSHSEDWERRGESSGKAIVIRPHPSSPYLDWLRSEILEQYGLRIRQAGGIDLQILGVGGRGHVAFHEAGIPFELGGLLLVELDRVTREHAVSDGYFTSQDACPRFALTMSLQLVFEAREVMVLANGQRKIAAVSRSLLCEPDTAMPMSYAQFYAREGGPVTFVLDQVAAEGLLSSPGDLERRGIELTDLR